MECRDSVLIRKVLDMAAEQFELRQKEDLEGGC